MTNSTNNNHTAVNPTSRHATGMYKGITVAAAQAINARYNADVKEFGYVDAATLRATAIRAARLNRD